MPKDHLMRAIGEQRKALCYRELIQIKRIYRVNAATLLIRLKQVGIINQSTFDYAFRTFARGWRKREPESLKEITKCRSDLRGFVIGHLRRNS